ncbi:SulP family inorganic anion transporter, partial [Leptospira sp. 96542]|nr:SulP family inorganic anion transporter [Leptospira sp. 96542]
MTKKGEIEEFCYNMYSKLKQDLPASLVIFLVALPLCLGVAISSGAPLLSGILSGVIGGVVVGLLSRSNTSVSGPAAGLVAVVFSALNQLGSFETFLLAVVIAGLIQVITGVLRAGIISTYIPSSVTKGLLAAIGIILILKQIPHAFGFDVDPEEDFSFFQSDGENTFSELLNLRFYFSGGAIIISTVALFVLTASEWKQLRKYVIIPPSLIVVGLGILINYCFLLYFPNFYLSNKHLVSLPNIDSIQSILIFPNFSEILNYKVWVVGLTIAVFASLETLLNLDAIEKIEPLKRKLSPNHELFAQGFGNIMCGMLGGIPVTTVIVRSSVNIYSGAKTKLSTILHGVLLLISVFFLSPIFNLIPLASLAAILIATGYKLTKISLIKEVHTKGHSQFIPFLATLFAIIFTDLLIGVLIGLAVSIVYILKNNYKNPFLLETENLNIGETVRLELPNQVSFLNKASIKDTLWSVPSGSKLIIDATNCNYIDDDILEIIENFRDYVAKSQEIQ